MAAMRIARILQPDEFHPGHFDAVPDFVLVEVEASLFFPLPELAL